MNKYKFFSELNLISKLNPKSKLIISKLTIFFALVFVTVSCKTVEDCTENQILGNIGSVVNSNLDEHSPTVLALPIDIKQQFLSSDTNDYLYFTATQNGSDEVIYDVLLNDIQAGAALIEDGNFPLNDTTMFRNAGIPVFYYNRETNKLNLYFAALPKFGRLSRDIFFSEKDLTTNKWSKPTQVATVNTQSWESHPTISSDGKILMFSSDREGGVGDIDIWVSFLDEAGNWSQPLNLGEEINTKGTDYTPMFTNNNDIVFSTNGKGGTRKDFDIYSAKYEPNERKWYEPKLFNFPINTEFNETGASIWKNRIYLSSDRRGGCGGKDIYSFQLCGPVLISGRVNSASADQILEGEMFLLDTDSGDTVGFSSVTSDGSFKIDSIEPNKSYIIDYKNKCFPKKKNIYDFRTPCSDSSATVVLVNMVMPEKNAELELTEVEIPFFVTGYYKPNTESNLNALRLGFSYNLYGNSSKTKYIENPQDNYNQYVNQVEASLDDVVKYIANMVSVLNNQCETVEKRGALKISVQGWADPRNISAEAEYLDEDIDDKIFALRVKKGSKMNNELLSKLRAYFTAKYFESKLVEEFGANEIANSVKWQIEGKGIDLTENIGDEMKRKVKILLQFEE